MEIMESKVNVKPVKKKLTLISYQAKCPVSASEAKFLIQHCTFYLRQVISLIKTNGKRTGERLNKCKFRRGIKFKVSAFKAIVVTCKVFEVLASIFPFMVVISSLLLLGRFIFIIHH